MSSYRVQYNIPDVPGLYKLHEPQPPLRPVCDIIAVHGLGGGPASTWTHSQSQTLWLRDYLPNIVQDIDNKTSARIWSFGYNANTFLSTAHAGISDFTTSLLRYLQGAGIDREQKKIIFIAHSLGGVVVKSALIDAGRHNSQHKWLLNATAGIVFLGTPHQGSRIADTASYIGKIAKYGGFKPNNTILDSLKKNSRELFDKAEPFRDVCPGIHICSFYEQLELSGARMIIVDRNSAFIGVNGEEFTPLNADHKSICKFGDPDDQNLVLVRSSIERMMQGVTSTRGNTPRQNLGESNQPPGPRGYGGRATPGWQDGRYQSPGAQEWGNYRHPSVEDSFSELSFSDSESRPSTNDSRDSFGMNYSYAQGQRQGNRPPYPTDTRRNPSPRGGPGGQTQLSHSRGSSSGYYGPQMQRFPSSETLSSQYSRDLPSGTTNSPYLQPSSSTYSLSQAQIQDINRNTSPVPTRKPLPPSEPVAWQCAVCTEGKSAAQVRYHCTVCDDYNLCMQCHMEGYTSKNHKLGHKLISIANNHTIEVGAITPCHENVSPQFSPPRAQPNWTEEGDNRWLHLRNSPSTARFLVRRLSKGAYLVELAIHFKFSDHVDMDTFKRAKEIGFGNLKISVGTPLNTSVFLNTPKTEDETLPQQLFGFDPSMSFELAVPETATTPMQPWILTFNLSTKTTYLGFDSGVNPTNAILGILLQWSKVVEYQSNNNPILLMSLNEIVMEELLEYDEPPPLPPPPQRREPTPPTTRPNARTTAPSPPADDDDDDDSGTVSLAELIEAAQILEKNGQEITNENLLQMIAATRQVKTEIQTIMLLRQIQQIREQQRREQEMRQRQEQQAQAAQAMGQLLLLSWLYSD